MSASGIQRISRHTGIPVDTIEEELAKELRSEEIRKIALDRTTQRLLWVRKRTKL